MNTPGHLVVNLAALARGEPPVRHARLAVAFGAVLPDIPMVVFYAWARGVARLPERVIWREAYFDPAWQAFFDVFNSVPLILLLLWVAWRARATAVLLAGWSMLLHAALDLPLHGEDAHRHFFPLSDVRFESPISYWDPARFGGIVSMVELGVVVALTALVLWPRLRSPAWRALLVVANAAYLIPWILWG